PSLWMLWRLTPANRSWSRTTIATATPIPAAAYSHHSAEKRARPGAEASAELSGVPRPRPAGGQRSLRQKLEVMLPPRRGRTSYSYARCAREFGRERATGLG